MTPRNPHRSRSLAALACLAAMCTLPACTGIGPSTLAAGRSTYNAVINQTEDEQILAIIVRQRYDETFGMLAVASVTASVKVSTNVGGNVGLGPRSTYEGNLVPLSGGVAYEDNPTISYIPLRGEQFVERMLAPISPGQALLLSRMSTPEFEPMQVLVRRVGGIANPRFASGGNPSSFDEIIRSYVLLREGGMLDAVVQPTGTVELLLHGTKGSDARAAIANLELLGVRVQMDPSGTAVIPTRFLVGAAWKDGLDIETPSALEILRAAGEGVEIPEVHIRLHIAREDETTSSAPPFIRIRSAPTRPAGASVAVQHRDQWFYVDAADASSKQAFMFLRTLIGMRLDGPIQQSGPLLTLPVGG
jgi:hypothetical protein